MPHDFDIVIVGAGMVGASLAIALAPTGLRIAVLESVSMRSEDQPSYDDRGITLSPSSSRILNYIGVWQHAESYAHPIKSIHVSEQGRFGYTHLDASSVNRTELGHVVVAKYLGQALHQRLTDFDNIRLLCPAELTGFALKDNSMEVAYSQDGESQTMTAGLVVGADGTRSLVRRLAGINVQENDFKQTAIVANVTTQKTNQSIAFERFTEHGPIALLPIAHNRSVMVYTVDRDKAETTLNLSDADYIKQVMPRLGRRLGNIEKVGQRRAYPIIFQDALKHYQQGLVLLGNAAHTLHPNAAQGFNLGLRDVAGLTEAIEQGLKHGHDISDITILEQYFVNRRPDQQRTMKFTNGLAGLFYNCNPLKRLGRNSMMLLVDTLPELKSMLLETSMGLAGMQPQMVRETIA